MRNRNEDRQRSAVPPTPPTPLAPHFPANSSLWLTWQIASLSWCQKHVKHVRIHINSLPRDPIRNIGTFC